MTGFIDIYAKLIIAVVSFIAPLMVYLLSVYSDGIVIVRENAAEELKTIKKILAAQIAESEQFNSQQIKDSTDALKKAEKQSRRRTNLLNPKRQIYRVFITLFTALLFVMFYMLSKDPFICPYNHYISVLLISVSFLCFMYGMYILRQIAWTSIETKEDIGRKAKANVNQEVISPAVQ